MLGRSLPAGTSISSRKSCMPSDLQKLIGAGTYAGKQLLCKDRVVAWSHARRFRLGRKLAQPYAGRTLLDYGCGDGTFLAMVGDLFPEAVGADVDPKQITDCRTRFGELPGLS